jgi:hypothetical protein
MKAQHEFRVHFAYITRFAGVNYEPMAITPVAVVRPFSPNQFCEYFGPTTSNHGWLIPVNIFDPTQPRIAGRTNCEFLTWPRSSSAYAPPGDRPLAVAANRNHAERNTRPHPTKHYQCNERAD